MVSCNEVANHWLTEVVKENVKAGAHVWYILESEEAKEVKLKFFSKEQLLGGNLIMETML